MATTADSSTVWQTVQPSDATKDTSSTGLIAAESSTVYGQSSSATTAAASSSSSSAASYYGSYPSGYTMYASAANPAAYYQVASNLRAQNAAAATAAAFPYGLAANSSYYSASYPVDYSAYNNPYYSNLRGPYYNPLNPAAAYASVANSLNSESSFSNDSNAFALKEPTKKPKSKKKKTGSCSPGDETYARVFIWDIDDITMLSRNIIAHVTQHVPPFAPAGIYLHQLIERLVGLHFTDMNELQEGDVVNIEDAVVDESIIEGPIDNLRGLDIMRRVAPKYASLRQFYQEMSILNQEVPKKDDNTLINYKLIERCGMTSQEEHIYQAAVHLQSLFNQRWQTANRCLELVTKRSAESIEKYANVVICNEGIAYAAAQLLVAGQSSSVPIDNIYSTTKAGKEAIFEKIQSRYGKKCSFVSVTSSPETTTVAKKLSIPVWPVSASEDLEKLFTATRNYLLG
ncbi:unnamed protein product [Caenorhabditis bovis]|uniref:Eyes absent homolog n=1 Tax=Caenorhabditis bovis TaxID=2654633 RepID=A0A8S1FBV5_9PELO|nr:unnamed protein product [Caenorhabditis bovis]